MLFEAEAWRAQDAACVADDLWPCARPPSWPRAWPLFNLASKGPQFLDGGAAHHQVAFVPPHDP